MKCLFTKLEQSIDNPALNYLNAVMIDVKEADGGQIGAITVYPTVQTKAIVLGGSFVVDGVVAGSEMTLPANASSRLYVTNTDCTVVIFDKYHIRNLTITNYHTSIRKDTLNYVGVSTTTGALRLCANNGDAPIEARFDIATLKARNLDELGVKGAYGDAANVSVSSKLVIYDSHDVTGRFSLGDGMTQIYIRRSPNIVYNTSYFSTIGANIRSFNIDYGSLTGDIANLAVLKSATTINVPYCAGLSGTLESLLEGLYNGGAGRVSGTVTVILTGDSGVKWKTSENLPSNLTYKVDFAAGGITLFNANKSNTLATYDGASWTYLV